jgi:4-amino-4-deoxy-L-arabinose transferase-like glycosyltransferase
LSELPPANQFSSTPSSSPLRTFLGLLGVCAGLFFVGLGRLPLLEPDEGRNAEVAREMVACGHWLIPHFNSLPYLDKPVVFFWMVAGSFRVLGISEAAARLPSALAALGTVLLAWVLARRMFDDRTAWRAGVILATAPLFFLYSRIVIFDMTLTFLVTLALLIFWVASSENFRRPWLDAAMFAALGVATLTKGPVGFLIPLLSILVFRIFRPAGLRLKRLRWGLGCAVFLALVLPWFLAVSYRYPDFPRYVFWFESLERFAGGEAHRPGGIFYYLPVYLAGFFPWSLCLLFAGWNRLRRWREWRRTSSPVLFLLAWAGLVFVFFSVSRSKLPGYFLPAMVPLSLLMARAWSEVGRRLDDPPPDWLTGGFAALIGIGILLALGAWQMGHFPHLRFLLHKKVPPEVLPLLQPTLIYTGLILAALGVLGRNLVMRLRGRALSAVALGLLALATPFVALRWLKPVQAYAEATSSRRLGRTILASPERNLPVYGYYYFRTGLPFYLRRPVGLVTNDGGEMTSNYIALHWRAAHRVQGEKPPADEFHGLLVDVNQFQARVRASSGPALVLIRDYDDHDLQALFGDRNPLPLWNEWDDAIWEVAAKKP